MKNPKIVQIEKAEKKINEMVREKSKMNREFSADGVDADEQKELDKVGADIDKLKDIVAKHRAEIEENKRIWEGRRSDYTSIQSQLDELRSWGHADATILEGEIVQIHDADADERWADATAMLDQAAVSMGPVWDDYQLQKAAQQEYITLRADFDTRFAAGDGAEPQTEAISGPLGQIRANIGAIDAFVAALDYVGALETLKIAVGELEAVESAIILIQNQKAEFDTLWAAMAPRLQEASVSEFPDLTPMQEEIMAAQGRIEAAAASHDYATATPMIAELGVMIDTYMAAYTEAVDARTLYESRLPGIQSELADASVSEFPALADQQSEIYRISGAMETSAAAGDYEQALLEMDKLVPLLAAYKVAYENSRLGQDFELLYAQMEPRFASVAVCNFGPLEVLSLEITGDQQAAANAASAGEYGEGIRILTAAANKLDDYDAKLAEIEQAKVDYEARLAGVLGRFDAIAQCEYQELDADSQVIIDLRETMESAAETGDYPVALATLVELDKKIAAIETTLIELDAARAEYEARLPPLTSRFDGSMQSDYAELEDEREQLQTLRTEMEAAATGTDYRQALVTMNAIERLLDDLDAQLGNLIDLQEQYEAIYAAIKDGLANVEACSHPELAVKRDPILALRDEMLAAAAATDFATALEKAKALFGPVTEFAVLEALLEDYTRRLDVITPRIERAMGFTYLSLDDDKAAITKLHDEMTAVAANAELADALAKMSELEKLVTGILALNEELKKQEAVYNKLHDDMKPKIEIVKKNDIEEAQVAADAVTKAYGEMVELGDKHEFIDAIPKADAVNGLIDAYMEKVDEVGDEKEAYEILRDIALEEYKKAKQKAEEYEDLKEHLKPLDKLKTEMEAAAEEPDADYPAAIAAAKSLRAAIKNFDVEWVKITNREAALKAAAETAIKRFNDLPDEAKDEAKDDYESAESSKEKLETALSEKKFDDADDALAKLLSQLDAIGDALKTQDEWKAEYEGHRERLKPGVEKANGSDFKEELKTELKAVNDSFKDMTETADREDYEGAVGKADAVDDALTAFDATEDEIEQQLVQFNERMKSLEGPFERAKKVVHMTLIARVVQIQIDWPAVMKLAEDKKLESALEKSAALRDEINAILDEAEALEEEAEEEEDDGVLDWVGDRLDDAADFAIDKADDAVDFAIDTAKDVGQGIKDIPEAVNELIEGDHGSVGEFLENVVQTGIDVFVDPVADKVGGTIKGGAEVVDDVKDVAGHVVDGEYEEAAEIVGEAVVDKVVEPITDVIDDVKDIKKDAGKIIDRVGEITDSVDDD